MKCPFSESHRLDILLKTELPAIVLFVHLKAGFTDLACAGEVTLRLRLGDLSDVESGTTVPALEDCEERETPAGLPSHSDSSLSGGRKGVLAALKVGGCNFHYRFII